ncbi:MAG: GIY-YIG nuclease family protein [Candidatus Omnitrophica bacterium]|nr:GIY-YIG nuclease family protein [Candidatus Omnitrophota bacterium]
MTENNQQGPGTWQRGSTISRDPTRSVVDWGSPGRRATRSLPGAASDQAVPGRIATGKNPLVLVYNPSPSPLSASFILGLPYANLTLPCKKSRCVVCPKIMPSNTVKSYATSRVFSTLDNNETLSCDSTNIIYLIHCTKCGMGYVGETKRAVKKRFSEHLYNIKSQKYHSFLVLHFNSDGHTYNDAKIVIIEKLNISTTQSARELREDFWIRSLVTAFPFGLNDRIKGYGNISNNLNPMLFKTHPYFTLTLPSNTSCRTHGKRRRCRKKQDVLITNNLLTLIKDAACSVKDVYIATRNVALVDLKPIFDFVSSSDCNLAPNIRLAVLGCLAKRFGPPNVKKGLDKQNLFLPILFPNKGMELLNFKSILEDHRAKRILPFKLSTAGKLIISFTFPRPCALRYFSYNRLLNKLDAKVLAALLASSCECQHSPFFYAPLGHIITGNVSFVNDPYLQFLFSMGSKFREPRPINWDDVRSAAVKALDDLITILQRKWKLPLSAFTAYRVVVNQLLEQRIHIINKNPPSTAPVILPSSMSHDYYIKLTSNFVITPADKASNNYVFCCKKLYVSTLRR